MYIHLNSVDPTTSMSRMLKRYIEDGRFIDPRIIAKKGTEPERIYNELKGEANGYSKYSNEVRFGEKAILIEQSENMGWDDNRGDLESSRGRGSEETRANDKNGERKEELADTPLDIASSFMNIAETYDFYNTYDEVGNETDRSNYINTLADDIAKGNTEYIINTLMDILDDDDYESVHDEAQRLLDRLVGNRYSFEIDEALDEVFGSSEESSATNILEEGVRALKGKSVDKNKVRGLAIKLRNEYGSSYDVSQFADSLEKAFAYMQTQEHVDYPTMLGVIRDIAKPVIDEIKEKRNQEDYDALVSAMKSVGAVRLTDTQMKEVMYAFDNYGQFKNSMMPIRISSNASQTLEQAWQEMSDMVPWILDRDTTEGAMPGVLYDALTTARQPRNIYREDAEQMANDLALRIIEEYVGGKPKQKANEALKEYRAKVKADYDRKLAQAKADIGEKAKAKLDRRKLELDENAKWQKLLSERDLRERQAEFLARNKREKQQARERQEVRQQKKQIQQSFNKLMHWISTPSEKNHVPKTLITPVLSFMHTLDFTQPVITMKNGEFSTRVAQVDRGVDGTKIRWITLTGASKDEVLDKFDKYIGRSDASRSAQVWTTKMQQVQNMFLAAANGDQFTNDPSYNDFIQKLDSSLADALGELLQRSNNQNIPVNELGSYDLRVINSVLKNMIAAINKGNKAYAINEDVVEMGKQTIEAARDAKDKNHNKVVAGILKTLRVDNLTPKVFMELLGDSGKKLYKELRQGLNTKIFDIKKASEFMKLITEGIDQKDIQKWTGATATVHEVELSEGVVNITDGQIMALYETLKRAGAAERTVNGIRVGQIQRKGVQADIKESDVIRLSDADKTKLFGMLTKEQIELADKMQKYLAIECSKDGNEVSNMLYGYEKFVDETYFPWKVDQKETNTDNASTNLAAINAIERSGFTKSLKEGANNTLIINDIFDIFTDHVADMASYHGFAAANKDVLRWLNYREGNGVNVKGAINRITGSEAGTGYIVQLLKDLNQMEKSNYIGTFTDMLMGFYKSSAVGGNFRVVAQQPTAYFRALNNIDAKYLLTVNPKTAIKNIEKAKELSAIAWWKSQGYYETSIGKSVKEIVTGQASMVEKIKEKLMAPAGWADDFTWGFLYTAVEKEQRALLKGQNISEEEFRKAVNDRFDEVIDTTQVVDSTLHRSQLMRSKDALNKIQAAFMAEPTKSYNMLLEAAMTKDKKTIARAAGAFLLSAIATSAAAAIDDGFRYDTDDDDWYEVWLEKFKENAIDNVNPLNLLPVVKDLTPLLMQVITGEKDYGAANSRFDMEAVTSLANTLTEFRKVFTGESNKSAYGVVMMSLKPISQLTGIPVYNLMRDTTALYNAFFDDIKTTVSTDKDKKKSVYNSVEKERDEKEIEEKVTNSVENHVPISKIEDYLKSQYKDQYYEVAKSGTEEELAALSEKIANGYAVLGMSDEEIDQMLAEWTEDAVTYAALDKAIEEGLNIFGEVVNMQRSKDNDKIVKHIMDRYGSSVEYERANNTESEWELNVNTALEAIDATYDYDSVKEDLEQREKEKAEKKEASEAKKALKQNLFDAVDQSNPSAQTEAIRAMLDAGMDAGDIKSAISDKYHKEWKEADNQYDKNQARKKWYDATKIVNSTANVKNAKDPIKTWNEWEKNQK